MLREMDLIKGLENALIEWGNLKKGEHLLILTDTTIPDAMINGMASVGRAADAEVTIMITGPTSLPNQEPNRVVSEAMKQADLIAGCLFNTYSQSDAAFNAMKAGARYLNIGPSLEAMASESAGFPAEIIFMVTTKIAKMWKRGKKLRVTCEKGTDLTADINPGNVIGEEGAGAPLGTKTMEGKVKRSRFGAFEGGFGTVGLWPEWSTNGVAYFDAAHTFVGLLKTPLKVEIEKGTVVNLEGDTEVVAFFERIYEKFGEDAKHIGEIMMGLNPLVDVLAGLNANSHNYAHRGSGTVHVAFGNSIDDVRTVKPGIHLDQFIMRPTLTIDDQVCIDNGNTQLYDEDEEVKGLLKKYGINLARRR